jgi:hypothetical protein
MLGRNVGKQLKEGRQNMKIWIKIFFLLMGLDVWDVSPYICGVLRWFVYYFQITMTALFASSIYISLIFVTCFMYSNVADLLQGGNDKAGFHAIEGYWEGVTVNHSWKQ